MCEECRKDPEGARLMFAVEQAFDKLQQRGVDPSLVSHRDLPQRWNPESTWTKTERMIKEYLDAQLAFEKFHNNKIIATVTEGLKQGGKPMIFLCKRGKQ